MHETRWQAWHEAAFVRRSRRQFDGRPVAPETLDRIEETCAGFRPFGAARAVLVREAPPGLFKGVVGSYGSVRDAPHCLVMVGPEGAAAEVGYVGEAAVLEAVARGLGTCWVGGLFRPEVAASLVAPDPGERVFAVSPVGRPSASKSLGERISVAMVRSGSRKPLDAIAPGVDGWPEWARRGAEAARLAPSALNIQPWRFARRDDGVVLATDGKKDPHGIPKRLDCGIAMLHFELGARAAGTRGAWQVTPAPTVALFAPEP